MPGGQTELVAYGHFMSDAYQLLAYPEGLKIWIPKVDSFLAKLGLPNENIHPKYLPLEFPLPSYYAAIDDINVIPYSNEQGRNIYKNFYREKRPGYL